MKKTRAQIICEAMLRGEITQKEANELTAVYVSESLWDHEPVAYPKPDDALENYIQTRIMNRGHYDWGMSIRAGEWTLRINRLLDFNKTNYDMLYWAGTICKGLGEDGPLAKLRACADRHRVINDDFPAELYSQALRIQGMNPDHERSGKRA